MFYYLTILRCLQAFQYRTHSQKDLELPSGQKPTESFDGEREKARGCDKSFTNSLANIP